MLSFFSKKWEQMQTWLRANAVQSVKNTIGQKDTLKVIPLKVLCVDDDQDFCIYLKKLARSQNIMMDVAYSMKEARKKIEDNPHFEAFIIDGMLPDGSGFDLVRWIREKGRQEPIGFLSRVYQDAASFRLLRETLKVDYVVEKPLTPQKATQLFKQLRIREGQSLALEQVSLEVFLADIKRNYQQSIYDKIELLEKLILEVEKKITVENLEHLRNEVHKIAGSAGSYGYSEVSQLCRAMELDLDKQVELAKESKAESSWITTLDDFFSQIKLDFQTLPDQDEHLSSQVSADLRPLIYLINDDEDFLKKIEEEENKHSFVIVIERDFDKAKQRLARSDFNPQFILVSNQEGKERGIIETVYSKDPDLPFRIGLLTKQFDNSFEVLFKGIQSIIQQPITAKYLIEISRAILAKQRQLQVLLVDDDLDVSQFISRALEEIGIRVQILSEQRSIEEALVNHHPDLLLLDFHLLENGFQFLQKIKSDDRFQDILIVLTSIHQDPIFFKDLYGTYIDDVWFKPLDRATLQTRTLDLLKGHIRYLVALDKNESTDLFTRLTLESYLNRRFSQQAFSGALFALAFFEIDGWPEIKHQISKKQEEKVCRTIGQALRQFKRCELTTFIREGVFAFVFEGFDLNFIYLLLTEFFQTLQAKMNQITEGKISFGINCGIGFLSKDYTNSEQMIRKAERALLLSKQQGQEKIKISALPEDTENFIEKDVLVLGKTKISETMTNFFQAQGFTITEIQTGQEALSYLFNWKRDRLLPLLIIHDSLPDMRGIDILKILRSHYYIRFPVLVSSIFSEEKLLDQFQAQASTYLSRPFNLIFLFTNSKGKNDKNDQDSLDFHDIQDQD